MIRLRASRLRRDKRVAGSGWDFAAKRRKKLRKKMEKSWLATSEDRERIDDGRSATED